MRQFLPEPTMTFRSRRNARTACSIDGAIATVAFSNPAKMNAMTYDMWAGLAAVVGELDADPKVRVIVVTGAGRGYCAGADMGTLQAIPSGPQAAPAREERSIVDGRTQDEITRIPKPVISVVNGAAAGLGLVQSLMCDIRFAAESAKFTVAFSKRGLIGEYGISWALPRLVGQANAMDLMFSSRVIKAPEALAMGMVNKVLPVLKVIQVFKVQLALKVLRD